MLLSDVLERVLLCDVVERLLLSGVVERLLLYLSRYHYSKYIFDCLIRYF